MARSVPQEPVERAPRRHLSGLPVLDGRERKLTKLPRFLKEPLCRQKQEPLRNGNLESLEPISFIVVALQCIYQLSLAYSTRIDQVDREIVTHEVERWFSFVVSFAMVLPCNRTLSPYTLQ